MTTPLGSSPTHVSSASPLAFAPSSSSGVTMMSVSGGGSLRASMVPTVQGLGPLFVVQVTITLTVSGAAAAPPSAAQLVVAVDAGTKYAVVSPATATLPCLPQAMTAAFRIHDLDPISPPAPVRVALGLALAGTYSAAAAARASAHGSIVPLRPLGFVCVDMPPSEPPLDE